MLAPANLRPYHRIQWKTVNWVGGEPGLASSMCDNYQQAVNTRAAPLRAFCCSQCSTHVRISKIDNGETKTRTRINFDNRLSFNIPTSDARKCKHFKIYHFYNVSIKHVNSTINSSSNFMAQFQHWSLFSIMVCLIVTGWWSAPLRQSYCLLQT